MSHRVRAAAANARTLVQARGAVQAVWEPAIPEAWAPDTAGPQVRISGDVCVRACMSTDVPAVMWHDGMCATCCCSAYILKLGDVVRHLFGVPMFARFAGTRTEALLNSPFYQHIDQLHGHAVSGLACGTLPVATSGEAVEGRTSDATSARISTSPAPLPQTGATPPSHASGAGSSRDLAEDEVDPDPTDEVMTGAGDSLTLMFAVFVDGVQLQQHGRGTTTVIGIKCLDLPGFLANTDLACYALAFIGGPKEPNNLSEIMSIILKQFKDHEPVGERDDEGVCPLQ